MAKEVGSDLKPIKGSYKPVSKEGISALGPDDITEKIYLPDLIAQHKSDKLDGFIENLKSKDTKLLKNS